jgi:predicted HTH domain antitoxin
MRTSTLHIKVRPAYAQKLKSFAKKRNVPVGELVREAVASSYQLELADLNESQRTVVAAYQGGYVSIGKLAEEMGMKVFDARKWLSEHDIAQNNSFSDDDTANA